MKTNGKRSIAFVFIAAWLSFDTKAQMPFDESIYSNGKEIFMQRDTCLHLSSFSVKEENGNNCIRWMASSQKYDGTFLVYRSRDGVNYEIIGVEPSSKETGNNSPANYFYSDPDPPGYSSCCYKIVHLSINNAYFISSVVQ